jgi:hypothetical protein
MSIILGAKLIIPVDRKAAMADVEVNDTLISCSLFRQVRCILYLSTISSSLSNSVFLKGNQDSRHTIATNYHRDILWDMFTLDQTMSFFY